MIATNTKPDAKCEECGHRFECPAIAECPECESSQVRRIDPRDEGISDALAELDNIAASLEGINQRLERARDTLAKLLRP